MVLLRMIPSSANGNYGAGVDLGGVGDVDGVSGGDDYDSDYCGGFDGGVLTYYMNLVAVVV
jgi:hypothetical protein